MLFRSALADDELAALSDPACCDKQTRFPIFEGTGCGSDKLESKLSCLPLALHYIYREKKFIERRIDEYRLRLGKL